MIDCAVCNFPNGEYCEYCPSKATEQFLAVYQLGDNVFFPRRVMADDYLHAVEQAEGIREDSEQLIRVTPA